MTVLSHGHSENGSRDFSSDLSEKRDSRMRSEVVGGLDAERQTNAPQLAHGTGRGELQTMSLEAKRKVSILLVVDEDAV